jgi:PAS domain S-box-containing protein
LIALLAVPSISLIVYSGIAARHDAIAGAKAECLKFVNDIAGQQQAIVAGAEQLATALSLLPSLQSRNPAAATAIFTDLVNKNPQYANILVCDRSGVVLASAVPYEGEVSLADRRFFQEAVRTGMFSSGEYVVSRIMNKPAMSFGYPVKNTAHKLIAVIGIVLDLDYSRHNFEKLNLPPGSLLALLDHKGIILFRDINDSSSENLIGRRDPRRELFTRMTEGPDEGTFEATGNDGRFRLRAYKRIRLPNEPEPYLYIRSGIPLASATSKANAALAKNLSVFVSLFFMGLFMAWFIGKRVMVNPAMMLKRASERLAAGADTVHVSSVVKGGELGEVARAFDGMAEALVEREAALRESEERWATTLASIGDAVIAVDVEGKITFMNAVAEALTGWTLEEASMKPVTEVFHIINEHSRSDAEGPVAKVLLQGMIVGPVSHTALVRKDGTEVPIDNSGAPIRDAEGKIMGVVLVFRDITEVRHAEAQLRESKERYRVAIESSNDGVALFRGPGLIYGNRRYIDMFGYDSLEEAQQTDRFLKIHTDDREMVAEYTARRQRGEPAPSPYECKGIGKNGAIMHLEVSVANVTYLGEPAFLAYLRDITERKRAEEALMQSEKKYRSIFDNALEGIFQTTPDGRYLTVNPALARMYGYDSPGEMMEAVTDLQGQQYVVPEDRVRLKALYRQQGFVKGFETQIYTKNRDKVWISMNAQAVRDPEGNTLHYEGTTENITERKRAEEELQKAHRRLSDIIDFLPDATFVIDREKRVVAWNKAIEEMSGLKKEEILGKGDYAYAVPFYGKPRPIVIDLVFERNEEMEKTYDHVQGLGSRLSVEVYVPKIYRGRGAYLAATASPLFDHEGNVVGAIETIRDTTEQKRIEKALQESEERYRVAIEHSNDGVALVRGDRHIYVNQKFLEIFGYRSLEEVVGKSHCLTVHPDDRQKVLSYNHRRQRGEAAPNRYEFKGLRKNGEIVYIEASVTGTTYQGEPISLAFLRDVTGRRSLEAQLLQAQKIEAIGTLAGGVAHDFNNILMALMGYANLLQMKMGQNDPSRVYVDNILASTAKAANITQSLLAFGRKQVMELKPHKINALLRDVEKLLNRLLPEDIGFKVFLGADATIMADMTQITQVLMNLATNARDAMPKGGDLRIETACVEIHGEFKRAHGFGEPGKYALVSVADTGTGMDEKTKERIFEPFFTTKEVGKGTGLGLSIVYGIVKQHNGYITVESEQGKGTVFRIYLPEVKAEVAPETKEAQPDLQGGTETILLAEDNLDIRRVTSHTLAMSGYTVIEAADGRGAVEKFREHQDEIKLVILDVVMPEKNGKEAYEEMRTMRHDVKALFMSGYTSDVVLDKGVFAKAFDYIAKPIAPNELLHKVRSILDR